MKKLFVLGLGSLFALSANAQSLEERVEALEFQSYGNFFKMSGQLEMRWDVANREVKDGYQSLTNLATYNASATAAIVADGGTPGAKYVAWAATDCGEAVATGTKTKDGCATYKDGQKDSATLGQLFLRLNMESKPSDRLSFYGRLSMAKYMTMTSESGIAAKTGDAFYDFSAGTSPRDASIWVERAFANYKTSNNGVFTFGRLPTINGAPISIFLSSP